MASHASKHPTRQGEVDADRTENSISNARIACAAWSASENVESMSMFLALQLVQPTDYVDVRNPAFRKILRKLRGVARGAAGFT